MRVRSFGRAIARSIRQGPSSRFSRKDRTFEVKKLFTIWLFALAVLQARNGPWALQDNTALELPIRARVLSATNTNRIVKTHNVRDLALS